MNATVDLRQMTMPDKLRLMEDIWRDLSQNEANLVSPERHGTVLAEREANLASGKDILVDWESAKKQLRAKFQ